MQTRDDAEQLVRAYVKNENLVRHMRAVEVAMGFYARHFNEDENLWRIIGMLHDFDWEIHPTLEQHPTAGAEILRSQGVSEDIVVTILSHANHTGYPRDTLVKKALFACDEVTGLVITTALVRPSKKLSDVSIESLLKKWRTPSFAVGVSREDVQKGADDLGITLEQHLANVLQALQLEAGKLGL